ncbi:hypothetical protein PAMA_013572 [Pampus argenteus]
MMADKYALSTNVQSNVTSYIGHTTSLPCWAPSFSSVSAVQWTRPDRPQYVLLHRDQHSDTEDQDPSFENRVKLRNRWMKGGDLSLSLEKVNPSDAGIYECRYKNSETRRGKRRAINSDPISVVDLKVDSVQYITARPGANVTLPCRAPSNTMVGALEWTRPDLESEGYVFLLRDGLPDPTNQHPSFENRVELQNEEDGNLSLVLKSVSISDSGTYECRYKDEDDARRETRALVKKEPISIVKLNVRDSDEDTDEEDTDEGDKDEGDKDEGDNDTGHRRGHYGLIAAGVIFLSVYVVLFTLILL